MLKKKKKKPDLQTHKLIGIRKFVSCSLSLSLRLQRYLLVTHTTQGRNVLARIAVHSLSVQGRSRGVVGPGVDEAVELCAGTGGLAHVAVALEGVGGRDLVVVQPALDQLTHGVQGRVVGNLVSEVTDDADGCRQRSASVQLSEDGACLTKQL